MGGYYLCSCSCCSKLLGVSLQKSWQLAGLLARMLAFWAKREIYCFIFTVGLWEISSALPSEFSIRVYGSLHIMTVGAIGCT